MSAIPKFYSGRSVFITGGGGFIGKQIIEKLLRSCSEIESIYMLIRPKKGMSPDKRLEQTLNSQIFSRLQMSQPNFSRKIIPIAGDVGQDFLGISDADRARLEKNVSVVIHSAATLNFMEPLKDAVNMNVLGVQRILNLCKELPKMESLVHISTGYSQVDKKEIDQIVYDPPVSPQKIIEMTRLLTEEELAVLTPYLLKAHKRPNTYTLTKSIAERLIEEEHGNVPSCIVRPTIVCAALRDPLPGWLDNFAAANGCFYGFGIGLMRTLLTNKNGDTALDVVPVDMVAHAIIAAGWRNVQLSKTSDDVTVYNISDGGINSIQYTCDAFGKFSRASPSKKLPVFPALPGLAYYTSTRMLFDYWGNFYIPLRCKIMDLILQLSGKKPIMTRMHNQSRQLQEVLIFFTTNEFKWETRNVKEMWDSMDEADREIFDFDIEQLDLDPYYRLWWFGIKKYILKEDVPELDAMTEELLKTSSDEGELLTSKVDSSS